MKRRYEVLLRCVLAVAGLDRAATYEVVDLDTGQASQLSGASLLDTGLTVTFAGQPDAKVYTYRKL
jgi:hypothetical protein